jgi:hypothetical protein
VPIIGRDVSYTWDESYTLSENHYLVYANTKDEHYRKLARRFLLDRTLFNPLASGHNKDVMAGKHAYSYVNALCSAMAADYGANSYLTDALDAMSHLYVLQYLDSQVKLQKESPSVLLQSREENIASSTEKITFRLVGKNNQPVQPVQPVQLHLRIPSYPARYSVDFEDNSKADFRADLSSLTPGQFFEITANGRPGSSFSMTITHKLRLEKLNDRHPEMVALMYGPRVLFAVDAFELASRGDLTEAELIAAKRVDENTWSCQLNNGKTIVFKPFTALKDEPYTTYLKIALS